ncbi:hypothetical protein ACG7TL_002243 [Trametes sanguinea]
MSSLLPVSLCSSLPSLPRPGSATAPSFDPAKPRSIGRFFKDLEFLFIRAQIPEPDDALRKRLACRYVPPEVEELWSLLPEASPESPASFVEFRDAVIALYPEFSSGRRFAFSDLERLVDDQRSRSVASLEEYGVFYRSFVQISSYLRSKDHLGNIEQSQFFLRALSPELRSKVDFRRQLLYPEKLPDDFLPLSELHKIVLFVISSFPPSSSAASSAPPSLLKPVDTSLPPRSPGLQQADPPSHCAAFSFVASKSPSSSPASAVPARPSAPLRPPSSQPVAVTTSSAASHTRSEESVPECHYCGALYCFIRRCSVAQVDIAAGRCKRNENGQLVLPTGRFVPRSLPGRSMRDRVLEWHRRQSFASDNCSRPEVDSSSPKSPSARSNIAAVSADPPRTIVAHIGQRSEQTSRPKADLSGQSASSSTKQSNGQHVDSESSEAHRVKQLVVEPSGRSATERSNRPRDNPIVRILERPRRSTAQQAALDFEEQAADIERQIASLRAQVDSSTPSKPVVPGRSASAPVVTPPSAVVSSLRPSPSPSPSRTRDQQEADSYPVGRSPVEDPAIVDRVFKRLLQATLSIPVEDLAVLAPDVLRQRIESSDGNLGHSATFDSSQLPQVDLDHVHAAFFTLQDGVDTLRTPSHPSTPSGLMCRSYPVASEADRSMHTSSSQVDPPPYASSCTPSRPYFA